MELVATVEVAAGGEDLIVLTATNLSMGGVFLEANPTEYPAFRRGVLVELSISLADSANEGEEFGSSQTPPPPQVVRAKGKIVRIQMPAPDKPSGFGIVITDLPQSEVPRLHALLARAPASKGK